MTHIYSITGMTCNGCVAAVQQKLQTVAGVQNVQISLARGEAEVTMKNHVAIAALKLALPEKYAIFEIATISHSTQNSDDESLSISNGLVAEKSKLQQLKPLLLIFLYLFSAAFLLNYKNWNLGEAMLDFMGLFYIVFSFFKLLDIKGFPESFKMYDPLAKVIPAYAWVYPFIELLLGLLFLMRLQITIALITTIVVLGVTTFGVTKTLLDKKSIQCACLGTALKLPMTEATFIENAIMLLMAIGMLFQLI